MKLEVELLKKNNRWSIKINDFYVYLTERQAYIIKHILHIKEE